MKFLVMDASGHYVGASETDILAEARNIATRKMSRLGTITKPQDVREFVVDSFIAEDIEKVKILFLDNQYQILAYETVATGTIDQASVYPREIIKRALELNARAIVMAHNHPSGNPEPSQPDIKLTAHIKKALDLMDIKFLDHFIVAGISTTSFAEKGLM